MHCRELLWHNRTLGSHWDMRCWAVLGRLCIGLHELLCWPVSSERRLDELHKLPHGHLPRHDRSVFVVNLCILYCWKLLRNDGTLGGDGCMRRWTVLTGLCLGVYELPRRAVSNERRLDELHELPHGHLPRHDRCIIIINLRVVHRRELLCHIRSLGRHGHVLLGPVLCGCGVHLHQLLSWPVSSKRCFHGLHELSHKHLPQHDRRDNVGDLHLLHCWELLWRDGTLGSHGDMRGWAILGSFGVDLHELLSWPVSSERCLDGLHELPHGHLPGNDRSSIVGDLCCLHSWELLRRNGALGRHGFVLARLLLHRRGIKLLVLRLGLLPGGHGVDELLDLRRRQLFRCRCERVLELRCGHV